MWLGSLPCFIIKEYLDVFLTPITIIINLFLHESIFPDRFKQAIVMRLLKKPTLEKDNFKNYRPVSNLNFLSKITEKAVASQIKLHTQQFDLDTRFQSRTRPTIPQKSLFSLSRMTFSLLWKKKIDIY